MLNGKYPLLLIELNKVPIPIYIDETVFKIALRNEDKAVTLDTSKVGKFTNQMIAQNTLQLTFSVSKESQYGVVVVSLLDKLYTMIGNLHDKYKTSQEQGGLWNNSSTISGIQSQLAGLEYSVSYYSETDTISDAVISAYTKISEAGSTETTVNLTLEKKAPSSSGLDLTGTSSNYGSIIINKGV